VDRAARAWKPSPSGSTRAFDVSQLIDADSFESSRICAQRPRVAIEGIMLKRRDSPYVAGAAPALVQMEARSADSPIAC
jgi:DNA ligase-1